MTVKITIINNLTNEVVVDNVIEVPNNPKAFANNFDCMIQAFPDCEVTFEQLDGESFASSKSINQYKDAALVESGQMTYVDYMAKWYSHA